MGAGVEVDMPDFGPTDAFEHFRAKARAFLREHERRPGDPQAAHEQAADAPPISRSWSDAHRERSRQRRGHSRRRRKTTRASGSSFAPWSASTAGAAKEAFAGFLAGKTLTANQIEFVDLIVNHLTEHGLMDARCSTSRRSPI